MGNSISGDSFLFPMLIMLSWFTFHVYPLLVNLPISWCFNRVEFALSKQLNTGPFLGVNPLQNPSGNIWLFPSLKFGPEGGPSADHAVTRITRPFQLLPSTPPPHPGLKTCGDFWRCWISGGFLLKMWRYHQLDAWFHGLSPKKLMILGYCTTVPPF